MANVEHEQFDVREKVIEVKKELAALKEAIKRQEQGALRQEQTSKENGSTTEVFVGIKQKEKKVKSFEKKDNPVDISPDQNILVEL